MNTEIFFTKCQEPVLLEFYYKFGLAQFVVRLYDNDEILKIKVKTRHIYSVFCDNEQCNNVSVFMPVMEDLTQRLAIEKGVYIPAKPFVSLMQETRDHLNLAYGLRCSQYRTIIRFSGAFSIAFIPESELLFERLI